MNQEFLKYLEESLSKEEYNLMLEEYKKKPTRSIRLNKIDYDTFKKNLAMPLEPIEYDSEGYYLNNDEKYGTHPYHHLGAFYFQEPSAMAPVNMYQFHGNEIVLDLCAAPGGKSTQILSRIPNGVLYSNDPSKKRSQILFSNIERLGYQNCVVLNETPSRLASTFPGFFDVILVDAPCSGEGMMRKDEEAMAQWTRELPISCAKADYEILADADRMLKKDGILIYSTCTFSREEDEDIVSYLVNELGYEVLAANPILKKFTKEAEIKETLKFYPFTGRGEGQYMALLRKRSNSYSKVRYDKSRLNDEAHIVLKFMKDNLRKIPNGDIKKIGNRYYLTVSNVDMSKLNVNTNGVELGEVIKGRFEPYHHFYKALGSYFNNILKLDVADSRVLKYLVGEEIEAPVSNGYGVIEIDGLYLGGFKASNGHLKNHYPKGLRNLK